MRASAPVSSSSTVWALTMKLVSDWIRLRRSSRRADSSDGLTGAAIIRRLYHLGGAVPFERSERHPAGSREPLDLDAAIGTMRAMSKTPIALALPLLSFFVTGCHHEKPATTGTTTVTRAPATSPP